MALVGKRTAAAGGADATVTTAVGVWGVIDSLLTTAGWTVDFDYFSPAPPSWVASIALPPTPSLYTVGQIVQNSGNVYQCITSGQAATSGGPTSESMDITDSTVHWRFITTVASASARVYKSTGESGAEKLWVRVVAITSATAAVNVDAFQFFDPTSKFGFNNFSFAGLASYNFHQFTYTAGNVTNYAMVADKDNFQVVTNDSANNRRVFGGGRLNRAPGAITSFYIANAQVTAGLNKTFSFASGNPVADGYQIGDRVFVVAQETNAGSPFVNNIPIYSAVITALTTSSITIDNAQATTAAGAFIGADPQPYFLWTTSANNDPNTSGVISYAYIWNNNVTNVYNIGTAGAGFLSNVTANGGIWNTGPGEVDPSRSGRVAIGEYVVSGSSVASGISEMVGILPKFFANPRTSDTLWNIARTIKEPTPQDYVVLPANTATPAGQRREYVGPFAVAGSQTFNADLYKFDSDNIVHAIQLPLVDKIQRLNAFASGAQTTVGDPNPVPMIIGQLFPSADTGLSPDMISFNDVMPQGVGLINASPSDKPLEGQGSPLRTGGEIYPFDTSKTNIGGTGGGFNQGFN